nr:MAG TPA: hypothetical protein [Caudoviricetes sp.]DAV56751.1 MAG TPA: hypothetical protein [Caudoviricetes sp.]
MLFNSSTCLPHFGHITQSESIRSPQCLQYFLPSSIFMFPFNFLYSML